jgi:hypothetical protein
MSQYVARSDVGKDKEYDRLGSEKARCRCDETECGADTDAVVGCDAIDDATNDGGVGNVGWHYARVCIDRGGIHAERCVQSMR